MKETSLHVHEGGAGRAVMRGGWIASLMTLDYTTIPDEYGIVFEPVRMRFTHLSESSCNDSIACVAVDYLAS